LLAALKVRGAVDAGFDAQLSRLYNQRDAARDRLEEAIAAERDYDLTSDLGRWQAAAAASKALEAWEGHEILSQPKTEIEQLLQRHYEFCGLIARVENKQEAAMKKPASHSQQQMTLRKAGYLSVQLGNTKGRMITTPDPVGASFLWVDEAGAGQSHEKPKAEQYERPRNRKSSPGLERAGISKPKRVIARRVRLSERSHAIALEAGALEAARRHLWAREAEAWDRATRQPGKRGGIIGRIDMAVYLALLAYRLKRVEPIRTAIADAAAVYPSTVASAIRRLGNLGMLTLSRQSGRPILQPPRRWWRDSEPALNRAGG
jgi:hypothetical protein